jgi:hypothetical protein
VSKTTRTQAKTARKAKAARSGSHNLLALPLLMLLGGMMLAVLTIAWLLWPRWPAPDSAIDAPAFPITIQGVTFNIPPGAIRLKAQRKTGAQERVDLVFMWPSLAPPEERAKPVASPEGIDRIFLTIAGSDGTLPPLERLKTIYPRYFTEGPETIENGLAQRSFRDGTPYHGEDVIYDPAAPERFLVRCTKDDGQAIGMCLQQRRIAAADITIRFPRQWLSDWTGLRDNIDRLVTRLRADTR